MAVRGGVAAGVGLCRELAPGRDLTARKGSRPGAGDTDVDVT